MSSTEFHRLEPGDLEDSFFERIIDAAPDGILLADSNRILRYLNPAATRILGGKQEELTGEPLPFEIECGKPSLFEKEASGTTSWYELRAEETRWQGEGVLLITMRDVTIYKTYENELQEQNRRLELLVEDVHRVDLALNTQQSGALGEMVVGIAHDLNNWLTPIVGFSEMLLVNTEADKEKMDLFLKNINSSAKEAAQAVQRLTRYSQLSREKGTDTLIDLNQVIEQCILLTKPRWRSQSEAKGIYIKVEMELEDISPIMAKDHEIREVITVLIFNAIEALHQGGTITIATRQDGDRIVLEVRDDGIGMTEEVKAQCLEPFYSTKGDENSGLGLPLVFGIVHRYHGSIEIESSPGEGAAFIIRLQAADDSEEDLAVPEGDEAMEVIIEPLSILLVDDQPEVTDAVQELLQVDGHHTEAFQSGLKALEAFEPGKFELVITDRAMPDMNGHELAAEIRSMSPDIPVIMLTGFSDLMQGADEFSDNVDLILGKPIELDVLRGALQNLFG